MFQSLCSILIVLACSATTQSYFNGTQLIGDAIYSQGFDVIISCPSNPADCARAPRYRLSNPFSSAGNSSATWQMAQWTSRSNISSDGNIIDDGKSKGIQWATADKRVILFQDGRLQLAVNADHEYDGKYKAPDAPWVHLLIEQTIGPQGGSLPLSEVTELRWDLDVHLLYMDQHIQPGYDLNLHAAIFPLYMTIQNLVPDDPEYGKYFWLGIGLYDDRVNMTTLYVNGDADTGSLIYTPAFSNFASASIHSGQIVHVSGDMIPFVRLGLQAAVDRGFLHSTDLSRYHVGGMNIGWELTGLNIGTIEIGTLSLLQYTTQNPKPYEFNRDGDTEGWTRASDIDQVTDGPLNGLWILVPKGLDPQLLSPPLLIDTSVVKKVTVKVANSHLSDDHLQLFWSDNTEGSFSESASVCIQVRSDRGWRDYSLDLSANSNWLGIVRRLRIDPVGTGSGFAFGIDYIRFAS